MSRVESRLLVVAPEDAGERLDRYLASRLPELSRSQIQRLLREHEILVNEAAARPSYRVDADDRIAVTIPEDSAPEATPEPLPLDIVYEDDSLIVVNKAAGQVVHLSLGHTSETLVNALLHHRPELAHAGLDPERPGIVHRLDRDTSGLLVVAANPDALQRLQAAFREREVDKRYLTLVYGHPMPHQAAIEAPIARDPANRLRMAVVAEGGRYARTEYRVLETMGEASLLEVNLLTGRTHQIRVHLASIGYPVVGDRTYGRRRERIAAPRQMLHAARLTLPHPEHGDAMTFEAPLPPDFAKVLQRIRNGR